MAGDTDDDSDTGADEDRGRSPDAESDRGDDPAPDREFASESDPASNDEPPRDADPGGESVNEADADPGGESVNEADPGPGPGSTTGDKSTAERGSGPETGAATTSGTDSFRFDEVDWESLQGRDLRPSARTGTFLVLFGALVAFYLYDVYLVAPDDPTVWIVAGQWRNDVLWDVSRVDWLSLFLGVVVVSYAVVPAALDRSKLRSFWAAYPKDPLSLAALGYVAALVVVGLVEPVLVDQPTLAFDRARQPPAFTSVATKYVNACLGPTAGGHCHGTWATPLGTTTAGESMVAWLVYGSRTALQFALISVVLMVPTATLVGTSAAFLGGRYDVVLMRYVEVQDAVPTVIVYFILVIFVGPTLFVLIVAYDLFNWSDLARLVRGEALSLKAEEFVTAARSAGAGPVTVVRRHLVPNLAGTIVAGLSTTVPKLVLVEALFSFLKLSGDRSYSKDGHK